ncbi:MAG: porin family protein [Gemmatimonadetes bacterium]|nr:porin family protein [Gemmatimonadota bacterium]
MKAPNVLLLSVATLLFLPRAGGAQNGPRPYVNVGYIRSFQVCDECEKADAGGSIRVGLLTQGRFGFYAGYLWFTEYHVPQIGYDDKGSGVVAGLDIRILTNGSVQGYAKLGLFVERFTSNYPGRTETETSPKPDLGFLLHLGHVNTYLGWQPSDPSHFNVGIGLTR